MYQRSTSGPRIPRWMVLVPLLCAAVSAPARAADPAPQAAGQTELLPEWKATLGELSSLAGSLGDAEQRLTDFGAENRLTSKGKAASSTARKRSTAARAQLQSTLDAAQIMATLPKTTAADAERFRSTSRTAVAEAEAAVVAVDATITDAAHVDRSAEIATARAAERAAAEKERVAREAEQKAKEKEAQATRQAEAAAKSESKKAAEREAQEARAAAERSALDAKKAAEEQKRFAAAAAAAAAAEKVRGALGAQIDGIKRQLQEQHDRAKPVVASLSAFLAGTNLTSDARNGASKSLKNLDDAAVARTELQGRMSEVVVSAGPGASKALKDIDSRVAAMGKDLVAQIGNAKSIVGNPASLLERSAGTSDRAADSVPVCEFTFEPADGKPMQITLDGNEARPLPTRARLTSGRHTLSVRRNGTSEERRELLLCGHVATIPIEPPVRK